MTEDRAPYAVPQPQPPPCQSQSGDRVLWLAVRQGLLLIVKEIERQYNIGQYKERKDDKDLCAMRRKKTA